MILSAVVHAPRNLPLLWNGPSRVEVSLIPAKKAESESAAPTPRRVLVVDDERLIADSVAEILNRNGYNATPTYSGKAAMQHAHEECPDIMLCDVMMPDCNGIQLAKAIRSYCPQTRIVLFSGNGATSDLLDRASHDGLCFELLLKPVRPVQLLDALKQ